MSSSVASSSMAPLPSVNNVNENVQNQYERAKALAGRFFSEVSPETLVQDFTEKVNAFAAKALQLEISVKAPEIRGQENMQLKDVKVFALGDESNSIEHMLFNTIMTKLFTEKLGIKVIYSDALEGRDRNANVADYNGALFGETGLEGVERRSWQSHEFRTSPAFMNILQIKESAKDVQGQLLHIIQEGKESPEVIGKLLEQMYGEFFDLRGSEGLGAMLHHLWNEALIKSKTIDFEMIRQSNSVADVMQKEPEEQKVILGDMFHFFSPKGTFTTKAIESARSKHACLALALQSHSEYRREIKREISPISALFTNFDQLLQAFHEKFPDVGAKLLQQIAPIRQLYLAALTAVEDGLYAREELRAVEKESPLEQVREQFAALKEEISKETLVQNPIRKEAHECLTAFEAKYQETLPRAESLLDSINTITADARELLKEMEQAHMSYQDRGALSRAISDLEIQLMGFKRLVQELPQDKNIKDLSSNKFDVYLKPMERPLEQIKIAYDPSGACEAKLKSLEEKLVAMTELRNKCMREYKVASKKLGQQSQSEEVASSSSDT